MGMEVIHGDIINVTEKAVLFAIDSDPDDTIWIPRSVITDSEDSLEICDDVDMLVEAWFHRKHKERFG
jgi:hypothetical protein